METRQNLPAPTANRSRSPSLPVAPEAPTTLATPAEAAGGPAHQTLAPIAEEERLQLSRNLQQGSQFDGLTTAKVRAMPLVDKMPAPVTAQRAQAPRLAPAAPAKPAPQGFLGRVKAFVTHLLDRMGRIGRLGQAVPVTPTAAQVPARDLSSGEQYNVIRDNSTLWQKLQKKCEDQFCPEQLRAFETGRAFLSLKPQERTHARFAQTIRDLDLDGQDEPNIEHATKLALQSINAGNFTPDDAVKAVGKMTTEVFSMIAGGPMPDLIKGDREVAAAIAAATSRQK